jgi:hypothetical protein
MANLKNTSPGQLGKYVIPLTEILNESMTKNVPIKVGTKSLILKNNPFNKKAIKEWQRLGAGGLKTQDQALGISLQTKDSKSPVITISAIEKPKINVNKGDATEGVAAAAIAARFLNKNKQIQTSDIFSMIRKLSNTKINNYAGKAGKYVEVEYDSPNKNPKISDIVRIYISLADVNLSALLDPNNESVLKEYADGAVKYVNSDAVSKWAMLLYENNRFDRIEVISDGLGGQKTTKVDVSVKVTNDKGKLVPVNINLSLKAGDVKQFGQVSGAEFEKQTELWGKLFSITNLSRFENQYDDLMFRKKKSEKALGLMFEHVNKLLNKDFKGSGESKLKKQMALGIANFASLEEPHFTLLQLGGGRATVYKLDDIFKKIEKIKFQSRVTYGADNKLPSLIISSSGKDFLKVRVKQEFKPDGKPYIRNYIEKESLFTEILAEKL